MTDPNSQDVEATSASRATDLIADFHARHEAWRRQGQNLAKLRADARAAAGREASAILTAARADIRRVVVDARRALLVLTAQLQAITEQPAAHVEHEQNDDVPESVLQARRDLQRLLADMRPELDEVAAQVQQFTSPDAAAEPTVSSSIDPVPPAGDVDHGPVLSALASSFSEVAHDDHTAGVAVPSSGGGDHHAASRPGKAGVVTVVALGAAILLGAGGWWLSGFVGSQDLAPPLAFIPRAPRIAPSWLNEQIPTLTASLIALPSTQGADLPAAGASSTTAAPTTLSLDVEVRRAAWVQSSVDSGVPTSRMFQSGETFRLLGARGISIAVRDAGAVVVSLNGGPRTPLGPDGQVVTRHFSAGDPETAQ